MDTEIIPRSHMTLDEATCAASRLLAMVALICGLLRQYTAMKYCMVGVMLAMALLVVKAMTTSVCEEFTDACGGDDSGDLGPSCSNASYSVPNPDPRLYTLECIPMRSHAAPYASAPYAINQHTPAYIETAGMITTMPAFAAAAAAAAREPIAAPLYLNDGGGVSRGGAAPAAAPAAVATAAARPATATVAAPATAAVQESYRAYPDDVSEMGHGWAPDRLRRYGLPTNQSVAQVTEYDDRFKAYNDELRTSILQPSTGYTRTEVAEPLITNAGLSFAQAFLPVSVEQTHSGLLYTQRDPRLLTANAPSAGVTALPIARDGVFDPRSHGYADERRMYLEPVTGQPRFYYGDINDARSDPILQRTVLPGTFEGPSADMHFIDSSNQHRLDLQERLMRKINERTRQRRIAPIRTF
jgi:hypothetical protein